MAKFGRFRDGEKDPFETYEGDLLEHVSDDCIRVMRDGGRCLTQSSQSSTCKKERALRN